jgi:predicted HTH domain antitoxin
VPDEKDSGYTEAMVPSADFRLEAVSFMSPVTLELPDSISEAEARLYLAIKLFEVGRLSCGQAAELAGYSKPTFLELLGKNGVPVFDYPADELTRDLDHARATNG